MRVGIIDFCDSRTTINMYLYNQNATEVFETDKETKETWLEGFLYL